MIEVVSAAIVDRKAKRMLLAQRAPTTSFAWCWCTPGGKVEEKEPHRHAISRELLEELGVTFRCDVEHVVYTREVMTQQHFKVICYIIDSEDIEGTYACHDGTVGLAWFNRDELMQARLAPADAAEREVLANLLE